MASTRSWIPKLPAAAHTCTSCKERSSKPNLIWKASSTRSASPQKLTDVSDVAITPALLTRPTTVNLAETRKGLTELQSKLKTVSGALERYFSEELDDDSDDGYPAIMYRFVGLAKSQLESLEDRVTLAESAFSSLLAAFDEKPDTQTNDFFGHLNQFLSSYKASPACAG